MLIFNLGHFDGPDEPQNNSSWITVGEHCSFEVISKDIVIRVHDSRILWSASLAQLVCSMHNNLTTYNIYRRPKSWRNHIIYFKENGIFSHFDMPSISISIFSDLLMRANWSEYNLKQCNRYKCFSSSNSGQQKMHRSRNAVNIERHMTEMCISLGTQLNIVR